MTNKGVVGENLGRYLIQEEKGLFLMCYFLFKSNFCNSSQHKTTQHNQMSFKETMAVCLWPAYMHGCYFGMIRMAKLSPEYCGVQHGALFSF